MTGSGQDKLDQLEIRERHELIRRIKSEVRDTKPYTGLSRLSPAVIQALAEVPRREFVSPELGISAYLDVPLSIGYGQTISQPFIVALMTELAAVNSGSVVLEVGTGSGYQAAVLAAIVRQVYSIERLDELASAARQRLRALGYSNVDVRTGDGYHGWSEHAPFDAIVVTAAAHEVPQPLLEQLGPGGRMIIPLDEAQGGQMLTVLTRKKTGGCSRRGVLPVRFVPFLRDEQGSE